MRSWDSRDDTVVIDEPFFAFYLSECGTDYPALADRPRDWPTVVNYLTGPVPNGRPIWYQKLLAHQLLPQVPRDWLEDLTNCFLIRHPGLILRSYERLRPSFGMSDLDLDNLVALFEYVRSRTLRVPPVIDASDLLRDPKRHLLAWGHAPERRALPTPQFRCRTVV